MREYRWRLQRCQDNGEAPPLFPEHLVLPRLNNTWRDTASAMVGAWIGLIYQITSLDRHQPFMRGVDPDNPLGL
jgi:homoserine O-succinyltransferase